MEVKKFFTKIRLKADLFFEEIQSKKISIAFWSLSFMGVNAFRIFIEFALIQRKFNFEILVIEYIHNIFFFLTVIALIWLLLSFILKINPKKLAFLMAIFQWIIIFPPIFDMLKTGGQVYWSFYALTDFTGLWSRFSTFFGDMPTGIVYFGTGIGFISMIIFVAVVVFLGTKSYFKSLTSAFLAYCLIFLMGIFPSLLTFIYFPLIGYKKLLEIRAFHAVEFLASEGQIFGVKFELLPYYLAYNLNLVYFLLLVFLFLILFFYSDRKKLWSFVTNLRLPQVIFHEGFLLFGIGLGIWFYPQNLNFSPFTFFAIFSILASVFLAWEASVIINDVYDFKIDSISNHNRPLQKKIFSLEEYANFGVALFLFSLLGGITISIKFTVFLLIYQILAWFYSAEPFRMKKIPILATLISAIALLIIFLMGFSLFSGEEGLVKLPWRILLMLFLTIAASLPLKDFKDIAGDRHDKIWTIPVIFGQATGRLIVGSVIFICFVASVFVLNESRLFLWALIFGSAAFLSIVRKEIKNTNIFWWIFGLIIAYSLILIKIVFF